MKDQNIFQEVTGDTKEKGIKIDPSLIQIEKYKRETGRNINTIIIYLDSDGNPINLNKTTEEIE